MISPKTKNKVFFAVMGLLIAISVGVAYYRYVVKKDYFVLLSVPCDPTVASCYLYECDPSEADAECSKDPMEDAYFYKQVKMKAFAMKSCVEDLEGCLDVSCEGQPASAKCTETACEPESGNGDKCYGPDMTQEEMGEYIILPEEDSEESMTEEEDTTDESVMEEGDAAIGENVGEGVTEGGNVEEDASIPVELNISTSGEDGV